MLRHLSIVLLALGIASCSNCDTASTSNNAADGGDQPDVGADVRDATTDADPGTAGSDVGSDLADTDPGETDMADASVDASDTSDAPDGPDMARPPTRLFGIVETSFDLVEIDKTTGEETVIGPTEQTDLHRMFWVAPTQTMLAINRDMPHMLYEIDLCTAATTEVGTISPDIGPVYSIDGITYVPSDGVAYFGGTFDDDFSTEELFRLDVNTGEATHVATISGGFQDDLDLLSFIDDTLFALDGDTQSNLELHSVDRTTGEMTRIGDFGLVASRGPAHDPQTGINYLARIRGNDLTLYSADLTNASTTEIAPLEDPFKSIEIASPDCP